MTQTKAVTPSKRDKGIETPKAPQNTETKRGLVERLSIAIVDAIRPLVGKVIGAQWEIGKIIFSQLEENDGALDTADKDTIFSAIELATGYKPSTLNECMRVYRVFHKASRGKADIAKPDYSKNWKSLVYLAVMEEKLAKSGNLLPVYLWASWIDKRSTSQVKDTLDLAVKNGLLLTDPDGAWSSYLKVERQIVEDRIAKRDKEEKIGLETRAQLKAIREGKLLPIDNSPSSSADGPPINHESVASAFAQCLAVLGVSKPHIHAALSGAGAKALETCSHIASQIRGFDAEDAKRIDTMAQIATELEKSKGLVAMLRQALDHLAYTARGMDISHLDVDAAIEAVYLLDKMDIAVMNNGAIAK